MGGAVHLSWREALDPDGEKMMRIPLATYRIQFNPSLGFRAARDIVSYLAELGISDLYVSPIFKAKKGSLHGYDVVAPNQLNPELGTEADFETLAATLRDNRMGWLQDVVPNHMAFADENEMLMDVLENGESSQYHGFFDVEWEHPYESIRGRLLAPFLGSFFGEALERGEIKLAYDENGLRFKYYEMNFPLKLESYVRVLTHHLEKLKRTIGREHPDFVKLLGIIYVLRNLPRAEEGRERYDQIAFAKRMLWELYTGNREIRRCMDESMEVYNGKEGDPGSFNLLDDLLSEQHYRLSFWKVATEEINYRRFFNINGLISLRIEDEAVFHSTHALVFQLVDSGKLSGLRIDHIDGLYDPTNYLKKLRELTEDIYIVVEKILAFAEEVPAFWPVQGTTGYEFINHLNAIFCRRRNERQFTRLYGDFIGRRIAYEDLVSEKKRLIMGKHMAGDIDNLAHLMKEVSSRDRFGSEITLYALKRALVEVMAHFPVYRTYISREDFRERDSEYIKTAVERAVQSNPGLVNELRFIEHFLLLEFRDYLAAEERERWIHFVMRFQQFTGPLMAKGFEDTILYTYNRLLSLNEVGGFPDKFGSSLQEFHDFNERRSRLWPHGLSATSTHDTKRGEDVRARMNVLSELPREWERNLKIWSRINRKKSKKVRDLQVPDRNDEYFLYQTLIGAWPSAASDLPLFRERLRSYIVKAVREAKVHTAWLKPDQAYEEAYLSFVEEVLAPSADNQFIQEFLPFQRRISYYGMLNSLSQTLIKMTAPGVPDFYQGSELWDLNLVDPDNRRPVDFVDRSSLLREIRERAESNITGLVDELWRTGEDGRIKLFLIYRGLKARHEFPEVFRRGAYLRMEVSGRFKDHIVAFARNHGKSWAVTVAPRFFTTLVQEGESPLGRGVWHDTVVSLGDNCPATWRNALTGEMVNSNGSLPVGLTLQRFPVALLVGKQEG
jgi:(1->4)-alpha-D-glucan 1-alpha-D-glucosylmutase